MSKIKMASFFGRKLIISASILLRESFAVKIRRCQVKESIYVGFKLIQSHYAVVFFVFFCANWTNANLV